MSNLDGRKKLELHFTSGLLVIEVGHLFASKSLALGLTSESVISNVHWLLSWGNCIVSNFATVNVSLWLIVSVDS